MVISVLDFAFMDSRYGIFYNVDYNTTEQDKGI